MQRNVSTVFCLVLAIAVSSARTYVIAQADQPKGPLKKITDGLSSPHPELGAGYHAFLGLLRGRLDASFGPHYLRKQFPEYDYPGNLVRIAISAEEKDIIPAFGLLYRVTCVKKTERTIEWIPPKDAPEGLKPHADSIYVPFEKNERCFAEFRRATVRFVGLGKHDAGKKVDLAAKLTIHVRSTEQTRGGTWEATVKSGDVVLVNDKGHKVRAVVPPDEKTRVFGWVELDAKPVPRTELARDKIQVDEPGLKGIEDPIDRTIRLIPYDDLNMASGVRAFPVNGSPWMSNGTMLLLPRYGLNLPRLNLGDLVALNGGLYQVIGPNDSKGAFLEWVPDKQAPPGLAPQPGSMCVPHQRKGAGLIIINGVHSRFGAVSVASLRFVSYEYTPGKEPRAKMVAGTANTSLAPTSAEFTVKAGDYILIAGNGYQVRAVVPPDEKSRVAGWVELDANGIPEADLIRNKTPFVRPIPKKE